MQTTGWYALAGGIAIGLAAALLLASHGRIAGISGILGGMTREDLRRASWRSVFVAGLVAAGGVAAVVAPAAMAAPPDSLLVIAVAGLLVGAGTGLGNGCTSGHGICGLARGSHRSLAAVLVFMATAALTVALAGGV